MSAHSLLHTDPELEAQLDAFEQLVAEKEHFLVVAHTSPDGDAVGATLGLALLLLEQGKVVTVYNRDPVPFNFQFLPGADLWRTDLEGIAPVDVTVLLDCGTPGRIGEEFPEQGWGELTAVVDHHKTLDEEFADYYVHDTDASATGEILYRLAVRYGPISKGVAKNLYCCVMTDTGSFRYSNTSRSAFRIAGELVEAGVEPWEMSCEIYENQPRERIDLLCKVLSTLSVSSGGRLAFLHVEKEMVDSLNGDDSLEELTDGFINYARSIAGVEVATQMRELGDGSWRVSFRSRGKVDVSALAERFGGGGHFNAAGCVIDAEPEEIERQLSDALVELLDK